MERIIGIAIAQKKIVLNLGINLWFNPFIWIMSPSILLFCKVAGKATEEYDWYVCRGS